MADAAEGTEEKLRHLRDSLDDTSAELSKKLKAATDDMTAGQPRAHRGRAGQRRGHDGRQDGGRGVAGAALHTLRPVPPLAAANCP